MIFSSNIETILQVAGLLAAGLVQGVCGFGMGLIAVGVLVVFHPPRIVIPSLLLAYFLGNCVLLYEHRKQVSKPILRNNAFMSPLCIGISMLGLFFGASLLGYLEADKVCIFLGITICIISAYYFFQEIDVKRPLRSPQYEDKTKSAYALTFLTSTFAALLEGFVGLGGPPVVIYSIIRRYSRAMFFVIFNLYFMILSPIRFAIYAFNDLYNIRTVKLGVFACVFISIGLALGICIRSKYVSEESFRKILIVLLFLIGLNLIRKSLS